MNKLRQQLTKIPGQVYLLLGVIIFAAANSVTRKVTEIGAANLIDGRNPISLCNVLFVGNLCALMALLGLYHQELTGVVVRKLSWVNWLNLAAVAILAGALAPALIFRALEITSVNNVILIGRIEPPLTLALSVIILRATVNKWVVAGAFFSLLGVFLMVVLNSSEGLGIDQGGLLTAGGAIAAAIAGILSKISLQRVPFGLFNLVRTAIATIVFAVAAVYLYGVEHFIDIFSPLLWRWMLFYGVVIVVIGQLSWFAGVSRSSASEISLANGFNPIAGVITAFLILGEIPTPAQYLGGLVIIVGILLNQVGIRKLNQLEKDISTPTQLTRELENGFRGI